MQRKKQNTSYKKKGHNPNKGLEVILKWRNPAAQQQFPPKPKK